LTLAAAVPWRCGITQASEGLHAIHGAAGESRIMARAKAVPVRITSAGANLHGWVEASPTYLVLWPHSRLAVDGRKGNNRATDACLSDYRHNCDSLFGGFDSWPVAHSRRAQAAKHGQPDP
jgi:hypothetical protein